MIVGVAYFDDPVALAGGWSSIGGEKAVRFNSPSGLMPTALWITNIKMQDHRTSKLNLTAHIRNLSFFQLSLIAISSEIGVPHSASIPDLVELMSGVASRIIDVALVAFPGMSMGASLQDSLYDHLRLRDSVTDPSKIYQPQFQAAFQENSIVTGTPWIPGSENVRLIPNRVSYAEMLFSYPVPIGAFREVSGGMSIDDFIALEHPAIAQVEVNISGAENPELIAFGAQMSGTAVPREWISQPEAHFMRESGVKFMRIHRVLQSDASDTLPVMPDALTKNSFARSSYSAGVLAENLVVALTSKRYIGGNSKMRYYFPTRAVYLRSVDRMLSFAIARQLVESGLIVTRYGFGCVEVKAVEDELSSIMDVAANFGFMVLATSRLNKDGV